MNPFEKLMNDVFKNKAFLEECKIDGIRYACICSSLPGGIVYTEYGQEGIANFSIQVKLPTIKEIKKNSRVEFRNRKYKVDSFETDSSNTSIKLFLVAMSKGI